MIKYIQMEKYNWKWFVVTDGAKGIHVINENKEYRHFHEKTEKIVDVTGAGDIVTAAKMNSFRNECI